MRSYYRLDSNNSRCPWERRRLPWAITAMKGTSSSLLCAVAAFVIACRIDGYYVPIDTQPEQQFTLSVNLGGNTNGTITSEPSGLSCDAGTCSQTFPAGTPVELTASSASGVFLGWSDACSGFTSCVVTMDADKHVGALFGVPGQALWGQHGGGSGIDIARAIASDADGNLVIVGEFRNTFQFGTFTLTSAGVGDAFVAKLDATTGSVIWAKRFGGTGEDVAVSVAVDSTSNIYVTGTFNGSIDFGGGPINGAGNLEAFVAKLDASGSYAWATKVGGQSFDSGRGIAVRDDLVVAVGSYQGSMIVNGTPYTSAGGEDLYVLALATDGAHRWFKALGGAGSDVAESVAIDGDRNVVVAGRFRNTTNLGGLALTSAGQDDAFVAKYAGNSGVHLFSRRFGSTYFDRARAVAVDSLNNILLIGVYGNTVDFGGSSPLVSTGLDVFVVKLSLAGATIWANTSTGGSFVVDGASTSISANAAGDIAVAGDFCGTVSFGGPPLSSVRSCAELDHDIFMIRLKGVDGSHVSSIRAGGTSLEFGWGVTHRNDGRTFIAGGFQGFAEFGGEGMTSNGDYDIVVLGLAPSL